MPSPMALPSLSWILLSSLVILSQVQGEDSPMELPSERISCPKGSKAYGSYCYALFLTPKPWTDADGSEPDFGGWEWSSTDLVTYSAWDEETCSNSSPDFCASLSANKGFQKWQRYGCEKALPYVCKFKD
ncbi:regenerating islet-derived protein 3-gamma-like isoform X2 [Echinops telfairi]|uniref:Regenerating islet-derived protein 3-gamma-like isoform X2 n=1 Tax=Echinops telfairi TaxID=9371 RepID=A0ABM0J3C4_ECHTE|nr:regenerating islet-derived protein 3-gamma-like isoform X2 [Echinops telfairi]